MKSGYGNTTTGHLFSSYQYKVDPYENKDDRNLVFLFIFLMKIIIYIHIYLYKRMI